MEVQMLNIRCTMPGFMLFALKRDVASPVCQVGIDRVLCGEADSRL